jgi:two-component system, cell cycle sensor histidine kinase and response regulator CckA
MRDDVSTNSQLQKLQALGQLAGGVAHDFNNILSIIEGYARMLERQLGVQHPARDKLNHILAATQRGAGLTRQLLAFGRQQILPDTMCDLSHTVREAEFLLKALVTNRIALHISTPHDAIWIPCSSDMVTQILINLAANARDAIPENGDLWIDVRPLPHQATLIVADNGSGMKPEVADRIFEPFFTTKPQGKGTGLGLSMVAGLMQQVDGSVTAHSHLGIGTSFVLTFPREQKETSCEWPKAPLDDMNRALRQKTILVVDDEESLLPILEDELVGMGMKVLKAANANSALVLQNDYKDTIDLLLTDVVMPGINGVRLAEIMAELRPETGVVFMTGYPNRADVNTHTSPLPQDALLVPKPFHTEQLSPALVQALNRVRHVMPSES